MKDVRDRREDDDRENGTNGDDRKGTIDTINIIFFFTYNISAPIDSPIPAHDELDTAE